ncbi:39S ribosomal protein L33, mitochondrial [Entomophthora muscae]|uniref:39S ribosomal protein L33, mitochondrial n=2 Tax=Entomophthora muscae TaxID=34485 RepID=A0ACC2RK80_9FUNG|nr:39S ribosomal protein L33, mitochondrial [Entomophthora muscae]KAJ9081092.1 39S ribosomal protein L33, mitochondrial [Entomophthora muscae]
MFKNVVLGAVQQAATKQPGFFKVTLIRSPLGLHPRTRLAAKLLGFTRIDQTVFKERNVVNLGHIFRIKELVKVENVDEVKVENRKAAKGFVVVRSRHGSAPTS